MNANKIHRNSVPFQTPVHEIESFLKEMIENSEQWKTMKLVVLGNGRIGKSTLLHRLREYVQESGDVRL